MTTTLRTREELEEAGVERLRLRLRERSAELACGESSERARLIDAGVLRPASSVGAASRQTTWVDSLPCLTLREPPRPVPRSTTADELDGIAALEELHRGWFPR